MSTAELVLFPYGIFEDKSDIRAHVSVVNRTIYVFRTAEARRTIERLNPVEADAGQDGVIGPTARGWLVPWKEIRGIRRCRFHSWPRWHEITRDLSTTAKGRLAMECVNDLLRTGPFPFYLNEAHEDDRREAQIKGTDILVFAKRKIQVKCDYDAGEKPKGTGNLFLQKAERNPRGRH